MKVDTKSRHRTKSGGNVFLDFGFPPAEAKRRFAHVDAQIDESIRLTAQITSAKGLFPLVDSL